MRRSRVVAAVLVALAGGAGPAPAQEIVKARQGEMEQLGKRMTAIKEIVVEGKGGTLVEVAAHADYIRGKLPSVPGWFPPGSDKGPDETWALPRIWQDFAGFEAAAANARGLAERLAAAAGGGDAAVTAQAFATLGRDDCGGCHTPLRRPQD